MRDECRTLLTGEPLEWQLTNAQRAVLGLALVREDWTLTEVPCGLLADCETYIYTNGLRVMRVISHGERRYEEGCFDVTLMEDGRIAPPRPGGKSVKLTAANLYKRRCVGVSVHFSAEQSDSVIRVEDHDRRRYIVDERLHDSARMTTADFAVWINAWCEEHAAENPQ